MRMCSEMDHEYIFDSHSGSEVCVRCGKEGVNVEYYSNPLLFQYTEPPLIRVEVSEIIARLHGGEAVGIHVDQVMNYIQNMHTKGPDELRDYFKKYNSNNELEKAMLAYIIYDVLSKNDHFVKLETVAFLSHAKLELLNKAGKILGLSKGIEHVKSYVKIHEVIFSDFFSLYLPWFWMREIEKLVVGVTKNSFMELEPMVCGVCINLCKAIKERMKEKNIAPTNMQIDTKRMKQYLNHLKSKNLSEQLKVSGTAIRRATKMIQHTYKSDITRCAKNCIFFIEKPFSKRVIFKN